MFRGLDVLTVRWATVDLPLNPQLIFFRKERETTKLFDEDELIRSLAAAEDVNGDVPERHVVYAAAGTAPAAAELDPQKVRPIQIRDFLRMYVPRRLLALCEGRIAALMTVMGQIGLISQGRAKAHQLLFDE